MTDRSKPRVRFSPSPTGTVHIGNIRTALYNWLFARSQGGAFILRIEDTDQERHEENAVQAIYDALEWLGLDFDGPVERQSQRLDLYRARAEELIEKGRAYRCYCTPEELQKMREEMTARKETPRYDMRCRTRTEFPEDRPCVIRARIDPGTVYSFSDRVYGDVSVKSEELDDFVLIRPNGFPTYNYACVVDDHEMNITDVIRGQDGLSNTPRQIALYEAFGWEPPRFAHVPFILGPDGSKLSKRHGAVTVSQYREMGFLSEGFVNALVRLGWGHGDQEVFSREELIRYFTLEAVNKSAVRFDLEKAVWVNGEHMRTAPAESLAKPFLDTLVRLDFVKPASLENISRDWLLGVIGSLKERTKTLVEMAETGKFYFAEIIQVDETAARKNWSSDLAPVLVDLISELEALPDDADAETLGQVLQKGAEKHNIKMRKYAQAVRVALTGTIVSPPLDAVMHLLGRRTVRERLLKAAENMKKLG